MVSARKRRKKARSRRKERPPSFTREDRQARIETHLEEIGRPCSVATFRDFDRKTDLLKSRLLGPAIRPKCFDLCDNTCTHIGLFDGEWLMTTDTH